MKALTLEFVDGRKPVVPERPSIDRIIRAYAKLSGFNVEDLVGKSQTSAVTGHRHELMFLIRRIDPTASFTLIGRFIGGRDMATVHEAIAKVEQRLQRERLYADQLAALLRQVLALAHEEALGDAPLIKPWQLLAAAQVLRDEQMTDAEARKVALSFIEQLEAGHA